MKLSILIIFVRKISSSKCIKAMFLYNNLSVLYTNKNWGMYETFHTPNILT